MKHLNLLLTLTLLTTLSFAQTPEFEWIHTYGTSESDWGKALATDNQGNVYASGMFQGTIDFDPGAGVTNLSSGGGRNMFIQKLNPAGDLLWAKVFPSGSSFNVTSITTDYQDNVIIAGYFNGHTSFPTIDSVSTISNQSAQSDAFIVKMNAAGQFLWARSFGSPNDIGMEGDQITGIKTDNSGNIYSTGYYYGTADFDPGPATANLTNSSGNSDIFIQKLSPQGNYVWAKRVGGSGYDQATSLEVYQNTVLITGWFQLAVDFNPGPTTNQLIAGGLSTDMFLLFLTTDGDFTRVKHFDGPYTNKGVDVATTTTGEIYLTGTYSDTLDLDPGTGAFLIFSDIASLFVLKLTPTGDFIWGKGFSNAGFKYSTALDVLQQKGVVISGMFTDTVDFDPGNGTSNLEAIGEADVFLLYLDENGNYVWAGSFGNTSPYYNDLVYDVATDNTGSIYSTGWYIETVDFDCGLALEERTSVLYDDIFILKMHADLLSVNGHSLPDFKLYPNPGSQQLSISAANLDNCRITICNSLGMVVLEKKLSGTESQLDIQSLSPGRYVVKLISESGSQQHQAFVKM
jgi:hypothetical protein